MAIKGQFDKVKKKIKDQIKEIEVLINGHENEVEIRRLVEQQFWDGSDDIERHNFIGLSKLRFQEIESEVDRAVFVLYKSNGFHLTSIARLLQMDIKTVRKTCVRLNIYEK